MTRLAAVPAPLARAMSRLQDVGDQATAQEVHRRVLVLLGDLEALSARAEGRDEGDRRATIRRVLDLPGR
jgi:hypothetical protein